MKIYTRTGDQGDTSLFSGGRVSKNHLRVEAYGTVDELNSHIGLARTNRPSQQTDKLLERIQNQLFHLGADLATPSDAKSDKVVRINEEAISWLEGSIDEMSEQLPELKNFILPGGCLVSSHLHVARTVCRRAERVVVSLMAGEDIGPYALQYLNRLSDWLFTLARWENMRAGIREERWEVE